MHIKKNEAQYDLDKKAAKISALVSEKLDKYEYLIGEDVDYKPVTVEQAKFDYFPFNKFFNKWLQEKDKEVILKKLKNIENKIEGKIKEQLEAIKNQSNTDD